MKPGNRHRYGANSYKTMTLLCYEMIVLKDGGGFKHAKNSFIRRSLVFLICRAFISPKF